MLRLVIALLLFAQAARADKTRDVEDKAVSLYKSGSGFYKAGNYAEAARYFKRGYELVQRPEFLFNLAQSYRMGRELEKARAMYNRFLGEAPPDDPRRPGAEQMVERLDAELGPRDTPAPATPPAAPPTPPAPTPHSRAPALRVAAFAVGAAAVASLAVAAGLYGSARSDYDRLAFGASSCRPCAPSQYAGVEARADAGYALFTVAGAALAADAVLWYFSLRHGWR